MASIAGQRSVGRYGMDVAASSIAIMLGMSALLMLYQGYALLSPLAVAAGAVLMVAAMMTGVQAYRRSRAPQLDTVAMMHAIAEAMPQAVTIRSLGGEVLFSNGAARAMDVDRSDAGMNRFPWRAADGRLLGWVEMALAPEARAIAPSRLSEQDVERQVAERTVQMRELMAHIETSREEERKAVARKLHGELGSSLTALSMHLAILSRQLPETPGVRERLREIKQLLGSAADVSRQIQSGLRPDKLELFGMNAAIEDLAESVSESSGIAFHLHLPEHGVSCPPQLEISVYRMLEQLLSNITQHAYATDVEIEMEEGEGMLRLLVSDNGVGFYPHETPSGAYGLCELRERAAGLGGNAEIQSAPGKGTQVRITLPLEHEPAATQPSH